MKEQIRKNNGYEKIDLKKNNFKDKQIIRKTDIKEIDKTDINKGKQTKKRLSYRTALWLLFLILSNQIQRTAGKNGFYITLCQIMCNLKAGILCDIFHLNRGIFR